MAYSDKEILKDANGNPIPQVYDPATDTFKPATEVQKVIDTSVLNELKTLNVNNQVALTAYDKSVNALGKSTTAETNASKALTTANDAVTKAEKVQTQFNQVVIEGDSSVEAAQARVSVDATTYNTLKERLDAENEQITQQLAQIKGYVHPIVQDLIGKRKIMAHRCAYFRLPENTLAGFFEAYRMGIKYFETDFRKTSDGHHVCIHDSTTARTSDVNLTIETSTLAQVQGVRQNKVAKASFYDNPPIPTLDDVLEFMRVTGAIVNLNFEYGIGYSDAQTVVEKIYQHNVQEQVILGQEFLQFDDKFCTTQTLPLTDEAFLEARKKGNIIAAYSYGYTGDVVATKTAMELASKYNVPVLIWTVTNYNHFINLDATNVNMMMVDDLWLRGDDK